MVNKIKSDPRIDKRIKAVFGEIEVASVTTTTATSREEILAEQETEEHKNATKAFVEKKEPVFKGE